MINESCNCKYKSKYYCFHDHTNKSVRDAVNSVEDKMKRVNELGFKRFIPTDHSTISSIYEAFKEADKYPDIKAGIGCEFYLTLSNQLEERKSYHITVVVANEIGYQNMLKLQYLSNLKAGEGTLEGFEGSYFYKARITEKMLFHFSEGLIITSGCRLSIFNQLIQNNELEQAKALLDMFSKNVDDFFIELHVANNEVEENLFHHLKKYAYANNLPTVIANDTHYLMKDDLISWNLLNASRHNNSIFNVDEQIKNEDFHIKSFDEIWNDTYRCVIKSRLRDADNVVNRDMFSNHSDIACEAMTLNNQEAISETHNLFFGFEKLDQLITFDWYGSWKNRKLPMLEFPDAERKLKEKIYKGMLEDFGSKDKIPAEYIDRIKLELGYAKQTNNISYSYFVADLMERCASKGIMGSGGRGSAGGLLYGKYCRFHTIDSLKYGLIAERAMNPDRMKLMDIDLDFASSERHLVVEILEETYGKDHVVAIVNYGYNGVKQALQTICRYLKVAPAVADALSKEITLIAKSRVRVFNEENEDEEIDKKVTLEDIKQTSFYREFDMHNLNGDDFIDYVRRIVGTINNQSIHASGILVMNEPVWKYIPVVRVNNTLCSAFDMKVLEDLNGLKIDILSVSVYDVIKNGLNFMNKNGLIR